MRSEEFFFFYCFCFCFLFSQLSKFSLRKIVKDAFLQKKKLNLSKLSYPTYRFVKVDNSKD